MGSKNARDVKETILILVFFVHTAHQRCRGRQDFIDEDEDGFLRAKLDAFADDIDELADSEVGGDKVLLLVDGGDVGFLDFFADYLTQDRSELWIFVAREAESCQGPRLTGIRSAYFWRIRSASALRFSKGCSSLNLERMVIDRVE